MGKPKGTHFVISASSIATGAPVYLLEDGRWAQRLREAALWATEIERDGALAGAAAREDLVCDPYAFMVLIKDSEPGEAPAGRSAIDPLSAREAIRAEGPTIRIRRPDSGAGLEV